MKGVTSSPVPEPRSQTLAAWQCGILGNMARGRRHQQYPKEIAQLDKTFGPTLARSTRIGSKSESSDLVTSLGNEDEAGGLHRLI